MAHQDNGQKPAEPRKTGMLVSLFVASALTAAGCSSAPQSQTQAISVTNAGTPDRSSDSDDLDSVEDFSEEDYCLDENDDNMCDDTGVEIDDDFLYIHKGKKYYGKKSSVLSGKLIKPSNYAGAGAKTNASNGISTGTSVRNPGSASGSVSNRSSSVSAPKSYSSGSVSKGGIGRSSGGSSS